MKTRITNYIRAAYPCLYLVSAEEQRVESELKSVADTLEYSLCYWTPVSGMVNVTTKSATNAADPLEALDAIAEAQEKTIFVLKDLHLYLDANNPNPVLVRKVKDLLVSAKATSKTIIILGCRIVLPPELEREVTVLIFRSQTRTSWAPCWTAYWIQHSCLQWNPIIAPGCWNRPKD